MLLPVDLLGDGFGVLFRTSSPDISDDFSFSAIDACVSFIYCSAIISWVKSARLDNAITVLIRHFADIVCAFWARASQVCEAGAFHFNTKSFFFPTLLCFFLFLHHPQHRQKHSEQTLSHKIAIYFRRLFIFGLLFVFSACSRWWLNGWNETLRLRRRQLQLLLRILIWPKLNGRWRFYLIFVFVLSISNT